MRKEPQRDPPIWWTSYVIEPLDREGQFRTSELVQLLKLHRSEAKHAVSKMERVQNIGWPEARTQLRASGGKLAIARPDDKAPWIWKLKTAPHPWRLYFYVAEIEKFIIYTHAVYKQRTDDDDDAESVRARNILAGLGNRRARLQRFTFPTRRPV